MDEFGFRVAQPIADAQWAAAHWPLKIHFQCDESTRVIEQCRDRYLEDMLAEQDEFGRSLVALEQLVSALDQYDDLSQVGPAAAKIADCAQRIATADEKAKLFNSREGLFDKEATDYTVLSTIKKTFDPFSNLWKTASLWINNQRAWMHGAFLDLDAEKLEDQVESQLTLVGKAAKFFERDEAGQPLLAQPQLIAALASATKVVQVAAGSAHSAAVTADGAVYTFGCGKHGKLGHSSSSTAEWLPRPVEGIAGATQVSAGVCSARTTRR